MSRKSKQKKPAMNPQSVKLPGKWIDGLRPDMKAVDAAHLVLKARLKSVETMVPLAAEHAHEDDKHIHQLRVATRRSAAALRVFRSVSRKKPAARMADALRTLRRAAGDARTLDVQLLALRGIRAEFTGGARVLLEEFIDDLIQRRVEAQDNVRQVTGETSVSHLKKLRKQLLSSLRSPKVPVVLSTSSSDKGLPLSFRQLGELTMPRVAQAVRRAGEADLRVIDNLHELRLRGKRLRYAAELFRCCEGELFASRYERLESFQESLGEINDAHEMLDTVQAFVTRRLERRRQLLNGRSNDIRDARAAAGDELIEQFRQRRDDSVRIFLDAWRAGAWQDLWPVGSSRNDRVDDAAVRTRP
ncbi:MAG: CHAD domain-containing protein [Planctomycetota bacterium]